MYVCMYVVAFCGVPFEIRELYLLYMASKHKSSTRKGRRKSSGEFSEKRNPSPDGKKPRNESIERDEDEVLIALNMASCFHLFLGVWNP